MYIPPSVRVERVVRVGNGPRSRYGSRPRSTPHVRPQPPPQHPPPPPLPRAKSLAADAETLLNAILLIPDPRVRSEMLVEWWSVGGQSARYLDSWLHRVNGRKAVEDVRRSESTGAAWFSSSVLHGLEVAYEQGVADGSRLLPSRKPAPKTISPRPPLPSLPANDRDTLGALQAAHTEEQVTRDTLAALQAAQAGEQVMRDSLAALQAAQAEEQVKRLEYERVLATTRLHEQRHEVDRISWQLASLGDPGRRLDFEAM